MLEADNVDPRMLIECLLDEIIQLKKELTLGFLETVEGATENIQHGVQEDGVEGIVVSERIINDSHTCL